MAETDLSANLQNYMLQLQQVEAALTTDPENEELKKLKDDLQQVITLTKELLNNSSGNQEEEGECSKDTASISKTQLPTCKWKPGDLCLAPWSEDGQYYEAAIDEITEDGQCAITFNNYKNVEVAFLSQLKPVDKKHALDSMDGSSKSRKEIVQAQREYKKKKAQKKATRMKQVEEEREKEKMKWQQFNSKTFSKTRKGQVKRSIFASPDNINGRVGVGTCGIGGKPMTEYQQQEKWRRPKQPPRPLM